MGKRAERYEIEMAAGTSMQMLWDGEGHAFGYVRAEADGRFSRWEQTWVDEYKPTGETFPGFVSAARAVYMDAGLESRHARPYREPTGGEEPTYEESRIYDSQRFLAMKEGR